MHQLSANIYYRQFLKCIEAYAMYARIMVYGLNRQRNELKITSVIL